MTDTLPAGRRKKVTIYDVAKEAGVAPSTVSRAFARPGRVNAETGERIHAAAKKLGYRAKPIARPEYGEATNVLALVVADSTNPVFSHLMRGFQEEAQSNGYTTILIDSREDGHLEQAAIERVQKLVDGVVLASSRMSDSAISQVTKTVPVVAVNRQISGINCVIPDTPRGMRRAVEHLASQGHEKITYLSGPEASWADGVRWRAVSEACHELSLSLRRIGPIVPSLQGGLAAFQQWREHQTSGVIAYNDIMAIGFMKAVQRYGGSVPGDVSVIGIDNSIAGVLTTPTLTTVAPSSSLTGARAARALINQLSHRATNRPDTTVIPLELIVRDSTAPINERR